MLTDLHGKQFGTDNVRLLEAVQAAKPDLIAVCGDLADEHSGVDFVPALMRGLVAIAPTYYVSGNHEWAAGLMPALRQIFQQTGVTYLRNTAVTAERGGDTIVLAGIDDPNGYADQKTPEQVAADVYGTYGEPFWLLLAHRNNLFSGEYCRLGADLTLSGHGHGGIWRLPWSNEGLFGAHGCCSRRLQTAFTAARTAIRRARRCLSRAGWGRTPISCRAFSTALRWRWSFYRKQADGMKEFYAGKLDIAVIGAGTPGSRRRSPPAAGAGDGGLYHQPRRGRQHALQPSHRRHGQGPPLSASSTRWAARWAARPTARASSTGCSTAARGPAVWSLRAQADRRLYQQVMKHTLEQTPHLQLRQAEVVDLRAEDGTSRRLSCARARSTACGPP